MSHKPSWEMDPLIETEVLDEHEARLDSGRAAWRCVRAIRMVCDQIRQIDSQFTDRADTLRGAADRIDTRVDEKKWIDVFCVPNQAFAELNEMMGKRSALLHEMTDHLLPILEALDTEAHEALTQSFETGKT